VRYIIGIRPSTFSNSEKGKNKMQHKQRETNNTNKNDSNST